MRIEDAVRTRLWTPPGLELSVCPDPDCDATLAAPARILEHHGDGSHTADWGAPVVAIRLLTSVVGDGPVVGEPGDVLLVDEPTAAVWADGQRAELVADLVPAEPAETVAPPTGRTRRRGPRTPDAAGV